MTADTEQLAVSLDKLTLSSFEAFCEDITSMFGNAAECSAEHADQGPLSDLKKDFKKLASVNQVQTQGAINGTFHLLLDQAGLFVLAGVFVMLPEKRIHETIRNGTLKDADYINDAIKEVGNLMVGSWDRIFREELKSHKHFKQTGTFVGALWNDTQESLGLDTEQPCRYVICRMKVDDFPEFNCAAVFSEDLFNPQAEPAAEKENSVSDSPDSQSAPEPPAAHEAAASPVEAAPAETEEIISKEAAPSEEDSPSAAVETGEKPEPDADEPVETSTPQEVQSADTDAPLEPQSGPVSEAIRQLTSQADEIADHPAATALPADFPEFSVGQMMNKIVLWVAPEDTVEDVLRQMQQHNVGYVLVGGNGQIDGLLSRSDIAAAVSPYTRSIFAHWRRPLDNATFQIRVKWFMSRPVHTIHPEASLYAAMETMMRHSVRGLPVVDAGGQALGMVTAYDIFGALLSAAGVSIAGRPQQAPPGVQ